MTVIERFHLSKQYSPSNFLEIYRASMELELKNYNMLEYNLFKRAQITFPSDEEMDLVLPDSVISREKSEILVEYLHKVFCERCGMNLKINLDFQEVQESKYRRNAALQIRQEVANVLKHAKLTPETAEAQENTAEEATKEKSDSSKTKDTKKSGQEQKSKFFDKKKGQQNDYRGGFRKDSNPDVVYGRDFEGDTIPLESITGEMGEVMIRCQVEEVEAREIRNEKTILILTVTDFTDSIVIKMFLRNEQVPEVTEHVRKGAFLKFKGVTTIDRFDSELTIGSISGIKKIADFRSMRMDTSPQKRVELHCHTKMSDMDGVTTAKDLVKRAYEWGHKAIAITDHGVVQAFPEANHCFDAWGGCVPKDSDFKVLYGMEAYLVDDLKGIVTNSEGQSMDGKFVVFDIETTGFSPLTCEIIEIGAVRVEKGVITDRFSTFVNPKVPIPYRIEQLTSINDSMVMDAPDIQTILPKFLEFCEGAVMVAHNADFDMSFIIENCKRQGLPQEYTYVDTVGMARFLLPALNRFKLDTVAKAVGVSLDHHHRAVDDAACTAEIFVRFVEMLRERDIFDVDTLNEQGKIDRLILNDVTGDLWKYGVLDDIRNIAANLPSTKTPATAGDSEGEGSDGTTQVLKDLRSVLVPTTSEILWGVINGDILQTVWNKVTSSTGSLVSIGVKQLAKVVGEPYGTILNYVGGGATYVCYVNGQLTSYTTSIKYPVLAGGLAVRQEVNGSVKAMIQLMPMKIDKVGAASVLSGSTRYEVADNAQVYLWYKGQYYATKLAEVNSDDYYLTGWYDNFGCAAGKRVRVIVAVKKD